MESPRKKYIVANWKMNFTPDEATAFINEIKPMVAGKDKCDVIFCAPYVTIAAAMNASPPIVGVPLFFLCSLT